MKKYKYLLPVAIIATGFWAADAGSTAVLIIIATDRVMGMIFLRIMILLSIYLFIILIITNISRAFFSRLV